LWRILADQRGMRRKGGRRLRVGDAAPARSDIPTMCGIAGIVANISEGHRHALQRMTDSIAHRGPDGEGHKFFKGCALGHRRLAIVDVATGAQPMSTLSDDVSVTFNGEIYGYLELRRGLDGFPYRTTSDTEVILALHARYGPEMPSRLPGMFAFAIWDERNQELLAARDRFGEKPFFYAIGRAGEFIFASEIKALLASGLIDPILDRGEIARYLRRQCVRADRSIYSNIHALAPGHMLRLRNGVVKVSRYWSAPQVRDEINIANAVEEFRFLLKQAVDKQLVADVPIGAFLSGGLDSTTICMVASELSPGLRTFSFDFKGSNGDTRYARQAAGMYETQHTELSANEGRVVDGIARILDLYDEPFADPSALPTWLLSGEARRHVKVALTGDGGDELFGGYTWYKPLLWMQDVGRVGMMRWVGARILNRVQALAHLPGSVARELRIMGIGNARAHDSLRAAHRAQQSFFDRDELLGLGLEESGAGEEIAYLNAPDTIDDVLLADLQDYMPADILTKIDRASMAHGLELRAPLLDVDFATFCISLPYRLKVSTSRDKIILREAYASQWPEGIRTRSKQGFAAPVEPWLADPEIVKLDRRVLCNPNAAIFRVLDHAGTQGLLAHASGMQRWTLLILAAWMDATQGIWDRTSPPPRPSAALLPSLVR
jgi:asparagine synthase (glutamine-hydrolysing)